MLEEGGKSVAATWTKTETEDDDDKEKLTIPGKRGWWYAVLGGETF